MLSSSSRMLALYILVALILPGYVVAQMAPHSIAKQENRSKLVPPPAPKAQEQFIVYWTAEPGWNTELLLRNNREAGELTVTPSVRTSDGAETGIPAVTIASGEVATVDLRATLLKAAPQLVGAWGSLVLRYTSRANGALYSSVMVRADGRPIAFHLDGFGRGYTYEIGSREGVWWLPRSEVTDYLILTNSGERRLEFRLVLYDASGKSSQQSLALPAHQSQRLSIRALLPQSGLQGSYGGIRIDIAQGARFLDSAHVLFDQSGGFSAVMKMFRHDSRTTFASRAFANVKEWTTRAPMLALSTPDPALGLPAGTTLQPKIFVRNTLNKTVTAHVRFNWHSASASGKSALLDLVLNANETKLLDVGALQDGKTLAADANWTSVILSAPVQPDEILAVAASYDQTGRYGAQTPFSDQLASHWEGGKWEVDSTHNSLSTVINGGTKPVVAELTMFYNQGKNQYQIQQLLAPEEQMFVDFGQLIHNQIPSANGQTLPANLTFGAYRVRDLTDSAAASLYEGKVIVDKTFGHVSYGCLICCGPDTPYMMYDPIVVSIGGFTSQGIQAMNSCTETINTVTGDFPTWWTDNGAIASASGDSIGGVAVGNTNNNAQSIMMYWGPKEDSGGGPCPQDQETPFAGTNVGPTITSIQPSQGLVGTGTSVTIKGMGFTGASVTGSTNLALSQVSIKDDQTITATVTPTNSSSGGGNQSITVTVTGFSPASTNFFGQIPSSVIVSGSPVSIADGAAGGCPTNQNVGISIDIKYQVLDQQSPPQAIQSSSMIPFEDDTFEGGAQQSGNTCPSSVPDCTVNTNADGTYHDAPVQICLFAPQTVTETQVISMKVGTTGKYTVRTNNFTKSGTSSGHGSITNGADINSSR